MKKLKNVLQPANGTNEEKSKGKVKNGNRLSKVTILVIILLSISVLSSCLVVYPDHRFHRYGYWYAQPYPYHRY